MMTMDMDSVITTITKVIMVTLGIMGDDDSEVKKLSKVQYLNL